MRETFNGNGRSCATCHPVANNFTIDPAFISTLPPNDPLFVAEFNPTLAKLEIPAQMRANSLILENVDGLEAPTTKFVLRSVPHNFSMGVSILSPDPATTTPVERTGWSGDGAPGNGSLRQFQQGAITQHYPKSLNRMNGVDFRLATDGELDRIDLFMKQLGRTNDLALANVALTDARAEAGRARFISSGCNACHGNAGANASFAPGNRNFNTGVESVRHPSLASFPKDGGLGIGPLAGGGLGDGTFNTPPLVEAADTGPFFHTATQVIGAPSHNTSSADTIEQAVAFYTTAAFQPPIPLTAVEIDNVGRFLRVINASFNIHLGMSRIAAAHKISLSFGNNRRALQNQMIRLAQEEIYDAIEVLTGIPNTTNSLPLNDDQARLLQNACAALDDSLFETRLASRRQQYTAALNAITNANKGLGVNLTFTIGQGTNMF